MRTDSTRSNFEMQNKDPSPMNAFQKRNFKLLVETQRTWIPVSNNTKAGKRVSATENQLLLKSQTIFQSQTIRRYISINSGSIKNDLFVQSITNDDILANKRRIASIHYARKFPTAVKTSSASFNELLDFSGSSLQATYGHLLIRASYRQFDQFPNRSQEQVEQTSTSYPSAVENSRFSTTDYGT